MSEKKNAEKKVEEKFGSYYIVSGYSDKLDENGKSYYRTADDDFKRSVQFVAVINARDIAMASDKFKMLHIGDTEFSVLSSVHDCVNNVNEAKRIASRIATRRNIQMVGE